MARGDSKKGDDFDDQFYGSKRRAEYKKSRGESHWAEDKYLERLNARSEQGQAHHGSDESCGKKTVMLLGFLTGFGWIVSEIVPRAF